jgi:hypothetical protein
MELGIHFVNFNLAGGPQALGPTMAATARAAERLHTIDRRVRPRELPRVDWGKASQRDGYHRPLVERSSP